MALRSGFPRGFFAPSKQSLAPWINTPHPQKYLASRASVRYVSKRSSRRTPPQYTRFGRAGQVYTLWYTRPGFRYSVGGIGLCGGYFYYHNLETVPITGRRRFNCVSPEMEKQLSDGGYQQVVQHFKGRILPDSHPYSKLVQRVMQRLIPVSGLKGEPWEVRVIDDPDQRNAFVIPGGKVFVFSGILPVCGDENGLAAVLGHEISHNLAHHVGEKVSRNALIAIAAIGVSLLFDVSGQFSSSILGLLLDLPNSRKQESEADYLGLLMMSEACYDPSAAIRLWERMAKAEQNAPAQFLSTHPASKNRITEIQDWLPRAQEKRAQSECGATIGYADKFKRLTGHESSNSQAEDFW